MTEYLNLADKNENVVDRASDSAEQLLDATRVTANSAIDGLTEKMHAFRDTASPAINRLTAPFEAMVARTQAAPVSSLLIASAVGAGLMALSGLLRSSARR